MSATTATLLAACIAALAATITLLGTLVGARRAEMRASHRTALSAHLTGLGEGIHQVVAATVVLRKRVEQGQDAQAWKDKAQAGVKTLNKVRPTCRYVLFGLDEPLRTLSRMPDWVATYKDVANTNVEPLMDEMRKLAGSLDDAIRWSYRRGLPPSAWRRWRLNRRVKSIRNLWGKRFDSADPQIPVA